MVKIQLGELTWTGGYMGGRKEEKERYGWDEEMRRDSGRDRDRRRKRERDRQDRDKAKPFLKKKKKAPLLDGQITKGYPKLRGKCEKEK
jgi:hypothetical protein